MPRERDHSRRARARRNPTLRNRSCPPPAAAQYLFPTRDERATKTPDDEQPFPVPRRSGRCTAHPGQHGLHRGRRRRHRGHDRRRCREPEQDQRPACRACAFGQPPVRTEHRRARGAAVLGCRDAQRGWLDLHRGRHGVRGRTFDPVHCALAIDASGTEQWRFDLGGTFAAVPRLSPDESLVALLLRPDVLESRLVITDVSGQILNGGDEVREDVYDPRWLADGRLVYRGKRRLVVDRPAGGRHGR